MMRGFLGSILWAGGGKSDVSFTTNHHVSSCTSRGVAFNNDTNVSFVTTLQELSRCSKLIRCHTNTISCSSSSILLAAKAPPSYRCRSLLYARRLLCDGFLQCCNSLASLYRHQLIFIGGLIFLICDLALSCRR